MVCVNNLHDLSLKMAENIKVFMCSSTSRTLYMSFIYTLQYAFIQDE